VFGVGKVELTLESQGGVVDGTDICGKDSTNGLIPWLGNSAAHDFGVRQWGNCRAHVRQREKRKIITKSNEIKELRNHII